MRTETRPRLLMVTAVWGQWHLRMHFEVNLPTLLADGNLPSLARACRMTYLIFTQASDVARIESAAPIGALRHLMNVEIRTLDQEDLANPIAAHHKAWNIAIRRARDEGELILLMPPDVAWSDNSFANVGARLAEGRTAVFMTYLRAVSDDFVAALLARRDPSVPAISVPPEDMVLLCLQNLHPLMAAYLRSSDHFPYHSEMILWAVPGEGVLVRVLAREMFIFDPGRYPLNEVSLPARPVDPSAACFMADSDEMFAVSLAPLGKDVEWHLHARLADPVEIGGWWLTYDSPVNDFIATHKVRWHYQPVTSDKWRRAERASDLFVRRTAVAREGTRLWHAARQLGCAAVAPILALAIYTGALTRAARGRGPALIFVPTNEALARVPAAQLDTLLTPAGAGALSALIRAHYVPDFGWHEEGDDPLGRTLAGRAETELTAASGAALRVGRRGDELVVNGARLVGPPLVVGGHVAYPIDRLLGDLDRLLPAAVPGAPARASVEDDRIPKAVAGLET